MGFLDFFKPLKAVKEARWRELGQYTAYFRPFGQDMFNSDLVRSCVRPLAEHTSKAHAICTDERIERILNLNPNMYMTGKDFLAKTRIQLELKNTAFIYIQRDQKAKVTGFYPVPYQSFEAIESAGRLFIKFQFAGDATRDLVLPWEDLAVLRKDYYQGDIAGDDNRAILDMLDLISTTNQGVANAVRATANLRGILKSTKAMLSREDIAKQKQQFVTDYLNLENEGGIASLDATQEFTPITMNPTVTNAATMKEFRENVFRYFGVNDAIITSDFNEEQMAAFYDSRIEPFLVALGLELTKKVFTERAIGFDNKIAYESSRWEYASNSTKLAMVSLVDRGAMTPNEWRAMFNLKPIDGGDIPIRRLDTATIDEENTTAPAAEEVTNGQTDGKN